MNLEFYRNFLSIVECGTLSATARALHVAQSALSNQVKQLEKEYGVPLFDRGARKMQLTDAGQILYEKARNMILLEDAARKELQSYAEGAAGVLRIGMTQAYPDAQMTQLLLSFHQACPKVRYSFYEVNSNEIMDLLRSGLVEVGIVRTTGLLPADLEAVLKTEERLCVYCCYQNPWIAPQETAVPVSALQGVPLAVSRGFEPLLTDVFQRAEVQPEILSVATSRNNPMMWARAGAAVAVICAGPAEELDNGEVFCRPLVSEDPLVAQELASARSFITLRGRDLSASAQKFLQFSRGFLQERGAAEGP